MGIIHFIGTYIKVANIQRANRRHRGGGPEANGRDVPTGDMDGGASNSLMSIRPRRRMPSPESLFELCLEALESPVMQAEHRHLLIHYIELYNAHRVNMRLRRECASIRSEVLRLELTLSQHFTGFNAEPNHTHRSSGRNNHVESRSMRLELMLMEFDQNNNVLGPNNELEQHHHVTEGNAAPIIFSIDLSHFLTSALIGGELLGTEQDIFHYFMDYCIELEIIFRINLGIRGELEANNWERLRMQLVLISRDNMQRLIISVTLVFYVLLPEDCHIELEGIISLNDNHLLFRIRINVILQIPYLTYYDGVVVGFLSAVHIQITTFRPLMNIPADTASEVCLPKRPRRFRAFIRAMNIMIARIQGIPPELQGSTQTGGYCQPSISSADTGSNNGVVHNEAPGNSFRYSKREPTSCSLENIRMRGVSLDFDDFEECCDEMNNNTTVPSCCVCGEPCQANEDDISAPQHAGINAEGSLEPGAGEEPEEMRDAEEQERRRAALENILHQFFLRIGSTSKNARPPHRQP